MITGSLGAIGFATANAPTARGCNVMLNGFADAATIDARQSELRELGISAAYHAADLRDPAQIADLIQTTTATHRSLDIVNNAGRRDSVLIDSGFPLIPAARVTI